ncbi:hypothetical protein [Chitinophaga polysaccharea]|uniref:hypothetical protein n=1 Tax=Chitinophaga polysaccharea TaxID=1293035 RepID=UPI00115A2369|nr:hypothetical protein [Chitinophaga polysaccharea]
MNHIKYYLLLLLPVCFSCKKTFNEELDKREKESGIVKTSSTTPGIAMRGEPITLYVKAGEPDANLKIFIGNAEAAILAHGQTQLDVPISKYTDDKETIVADTFRMLVPDSSQIGETSIYIVVNGVRSAPFKFTVKKPDILYPGAVTVSPLLMTTRAALEPVDGAVGVATVGAVHDMGMDKEGAIYFIDNGAFDYNPDHGYNRRNMTIRKFAGNRIVTLGGGGSNEFATKLGDLKLNSIDAMKIAEDGTIYLAVTNAPLTRITLPGSTDVLEYELRFHRILKINPQTNEVKTLVGRNDKYCLDNGMVYEAIVDGPADKAMIGAVQSMELDKAGNLYFLDGGLAGGGAVLRKISADGMVTTEAGAVDDLADYVFYDNDGTHPETIKAGAYVNNSANTADGFGSKARIYSPRGIVLGGNGKIYLAQGAGSAEMKECVREYNPLTKEVTTIIGKAVNAPDNFLYSGTFKEVDMRTITSFDADFDGNILIGYDEQIYVEEPRCIYKIDVNKEMVYKIAGYKGASDATKPQPGQTAIVGAVSRILFDQFGKLYVGYTRYDFFDQIHLSTISITR